MTCIRDYLTVAEAVQLADDLLYHVKQHGKRNIAYYQGQTIRLVRDPGADSSPERPGFCRSPAICYHPATLIVSVPATGGITPYWCPMSIASFAELASPRLQQT